MKATTIQPFIEFLHVFDLFFSKELEGRFGKEEINNIIQSAQKHFKKIQDCIPDIDNSSPWLKNLIGISYEIGLWKELEKRGVALTEISVITQKTLQSMTRSSISEEKILGIRALMCSEEYVRQIALASQQKDGQADWLFECVLPREGDEFTIGMNIYRCPVSVLCEQLGVERYFPYFCVNDYVTHGVLGISLNRTQTLAHHAPYCDFRLAKGEIGIENIICNPEKLPEFENDGGNE